MIHIKLAKKSKLMSAAVVISTSRVNPKYSDRQAYANYADPDQMPQNASPINYRVEVFKYCWMN